MLKKLVVLNMRNCKRLKSFPSKLEMVSLQILILSGCLKMEKLPEDLGRMTSLTELLIDRTSITELPFYCNLEQVSDAIGGLPCLKYLFLKGNHLSKVPQSIGGLSCLEELNLEGNNFTSLPKSFSQLSHLYYLRLDGCIKLEVLPELPHSLYDLYASDCTSLREMSGANPNISKMSTYLINCPKLFKNHATDSQLSICETQCLDSSITSQGSTN
ncbi:NB-ARC domains-containing protein [Tanacetum coccineum]